MRPQVPRILPMLLLGAMLATPALIQRFSDSSRANRSLDTVTALSRYGFYFEEVSAEAGVAFTHLAPQLDPKLDHIMEEVASVGASVAVVDFDRDGWQDFYVTNSREGSANALFRNLGDGTFEDVAPRMGVADLNVRGTGVSMGSVWGDFDKDGYEDLFLYKWGSPELYHNDSGNGFTRVTDKAAFPRWINANTAVWFDYDRDGALDLFVGGYYPEHINLWKLETTRIMPESFEYARNGGRNYLFHNRGDGSFEEVAERMGLTSTRWTLAAAAADLRGTGYPDLVLANDYGVEEIYFNESGERFREAGGQTRIGFVPKSGMNVSYGDIMSEGRFAIYISNISEPGVLLQGNNLWMPVDAPDGQYDNMASILGVEIGGWSYGAQFGDLNNDGALDLYLVNGLFSGIPGSDYWYDHSKVAGGHRSIIEDARNWPPMEGRSHSGYQKTHVWINSGPYGFTDVAALVGAGDTYDGRAVALVDLWNRGVLDVVVANQRGPLLIYRNTVVPEHHWIGFALEGNQDNRSPIGAQVTLFWDGKRQLQEVSGGSGFASQNQRSLHFGLGSVEQVEKAVIRWPSGVEQILSAPALGRVHRITEPE